MQMQTKRGFESGLVTEEELVRDLKTLAQSNPSLYRYFAIAIAQSAAAERKATQDEVDVFFSLLRTKLYSAQ